MTSRPFLAVTLFLHRRTHQLGRIGRMLTFFRRRVPTFVIANLNDPSPEVAKWCREFGPDTTTRHRTVGIAEDFPAVQTRLLREGIDEIRPEWVLFQPDDEWLSPSTAEGLVRVMQSPDVDVVHYRPVYFWTETSVRPDAYQTTDPMAWRWRPGMIYPAQRQLLAPADLVDEARARGRTALLSEGVYDFGFSTEQDRKAAWEKARRIGKIDLFTSQVLDEPSVLVPLSVEEYDD